MTRHLLFVCAANVCRSPLMALTFAEPTAKSTEISDWDVLSRGISVARKHQMCRLAASMITGEAPKALAASHVSTQIAESELESHPLIITASREERARLARMLPASRSKTFTLKEAIVLGRPPLDAAERDRVDDLAKSRSLATYAEFLHQRRGRVMMPLGSRVRLPWTQVDDPQDVPDVHHDHSRRHTRTLRETRELVHTLRSQIDGFLTPVD